MDFSKIPNIDYSDFYKFTASFSLIIFFGGLWIILRLQERIITPNIIISFIIFLIIIIVIAILSFFWAMKQWRKNQKKLDEQLEIDTYLKEGEYKKIVNELAKAKDNDSAMNKFKKPPSRNSLDLSDYKREQIDKEIKGK